MPSGGDHGFEGGLTGGFVLLLTVVLVLEGLTQMEPIDNPMGFESTTGS